MVSNGLKRAVAVLAVGGATVVLGGMAAGTVSAQQTPTPAQSPTPRQGVTGTQGADREAQQDNFLAALAAKLNVTVDQLKQAMQQTRQELGIPERGQGGHTKSGAQGGRGGPGIGLDAAARAIGIEANQLRQELAGKTLADVARAHGVDPNTVGSALKNEAITRIDQAVTAGRLTAEQANAMKQSLDQRIDQQLNRQAPANAGQRGGRPQTGNSPTEGNSPTQGTAPIRGFQPRGGVSLEQTPRPARGLIPESASRASFNSTILARGSVKRSDAIYYPAFFALSSLSCIRPPFHPGAQRRIFPSSVQVAVGKATVLTYQAAASVSVAGDGIGGFHDWPVRFIAFRVVRSFRMQAIKATFFGFPAVSSRW